MENTTIWIDQIFKKLQVMYNEEIKINIISLSIICIAWKFCYMWPFLEQHHLFL